MEAGKLIFQDPNYLIISGRVHQHLPERESSGCRSRHDSGCRKIPGLHDLFDWM